MANNSTCKKSLKMTKGYVYRRMTDNAMAKRKRTKEQAMIYKTIHRKLKSEQHKPGVNSGAPEGLAVPAKHVTIVLLLNATDIV